MFFIVGRARSGTTLLQTILDAHPSVIIPSESCVLMHLKNKYFRCSNWSNKTVDVFLNDILKERKLKLFWNLDIEKIKKQIHPIPESARSFVLLCKIVYTNYSSVFEQKDITLIGDKNPIYTLFIKDLIELFPEAKFIHIVRDFRANIVSNREVFSIKNIAVLAHSWKYHNKKVEVAKLRYPNKFLMLKYEDLAVNPVDEMKRVCDFLNIIYDSSMFNYHQTINKTVDLEEKNRFHKIHGNLLNPINNDKVNSWKKSLNQADLTLTEYIAGRYALKYGYSSSLNSKVNTSMILKSVYGSLTNRILNLIIQAYYFSPFFIKEIIAGFSGKMKDWFKLKNYYNQTDYIE